MGSILLAIYLIILSIFDGKEHRIPVVGVATGLAVEVCVVIYRCVRYVDEWQWILLSAVLGIIPGIIMLGVAYFTAKTGYGDGLVLIGVGMLMGYGNCMMLIGFSLLFMSVWCIGILFCRKGNRNTKVPYLPFLTAVYLIGLII